MAVERFKTFPAPNEKFRKTAGVCRAAECGRTGFFDVLVMKERNSEEVDAEKTLLFDGPAES